MWWQSIPSWLPSHADLAFAQDLQESLNSLSYEVHATDARFANTLNKFLALSNTQFIENV